MEYYEWLFISKLFRKRKDGVSWDECLPIKDRSKMILDTMSESKREGGEKGRVKRRKVERDGGDEERRREIFIIRVLKI